MKKKDKVVVYRNGVIWAEFENYVVVGVKENKTWGSIHGEFTIDEQLTIIRELAKALEEFSNL